MIIVIPEERAATGLGAEGDETVPHGRQWEPHLVSRRHGPVDEHVFFGEEAKID